MVNFVLSTRGNSKPELATVVVKIKSRSGNRHSMYQRGSNCKCNINTIGIIFLFFDTGPTYNIYTSSNASLGHTGMDP